MKRELTPQEKKQLSYDHDRRNSYGENDKSSRKAIRLRKRIVARTYRRATGQQIPKNALAGSAEDLEAAEGRVLATKRPGWRKWPDMPLREFVARQQNGRVLRHGRKKRSRASRGESETDS